jgi:lauroyl/myristoyl acyltransferase
MTFKISTFFQSPLNVLLVRHLSPRISQRYLHFVGSLYYLLNRHEKRTIENNVREVLAGKDEREIRRVIRETFRGITTHYYEKMCSAYIDYQRVARFVDERFEVRGGDLLRQAMQKGKGCILVTAHWGAVEFIPWVLHRKGFPSSIILECATAKLARSLQGQVDHADAELISTGCGSIFRRALQSLGANRVLMTECDEVDAWRKRPNHTIQLFGKELYFDNAIDVLAHHSGAPVVAAFLERLGHGRYALIVEDVSVRRSPPSTARECLKLLQQYISRFPEQWYQWKKWGEMKSA